MRILLVMPTPFEVGRLGLENVVWLSEPVALTAIGAMVSDEHDVEILDMRLEDEDALALKLASFQPHLVGTTSMTTDVYQAKAVLRMAREIVPDALTVVGGHAPTLSPEEFNEDYIDVIVQGEGELTFQELVRRWDQQRTGADRTFFELPGSRYWQTDERRFVNQKRAQETSLDSLPAPNRELIRQYQGRYFFTVARPMASIFTSRGCSFDCNFCAIWEFYERRTRYLSAKKIVDQMEACDEPFLFILDDNFLTNKRRIRELCEELETRGVKKYWMTQGRTDFVADNPELMKRLADNGLVGLLSGFESNDDDSLKSLRKKSSWQKNIRANRMMEELGIFSTGIFMVRADWDEQQFYNLYEYINTLSIGIPLVTILTPLPGTQLHRAYKDKLLTTDHRLYDLLHSVLPTKLPRERFYQLFSQSIKRTMPSAHKAMAVMWRRRFDFVRKVLPNFAWFYARTWRYQRVHGDYRSFLRDEQGLLNGPGAQAGIGWDDVQYPNGEEHSKAAQSNESAKLVQLRIPRRLWTDDIKDRRQEQTAVGAEL